MTDAAHANSLNHAGVEQICACERTCHTSKPERECFFLAEDIPKDLL